jgi:heme/copper-type cytochrome/quinol oxidase subunit 3
MTSMTVSGNVSVAAKSNPKIPNAVVATAMLTGAEVMFFTALISAYMIIRASYGNWVPPGDIRLPIYATLLNTFILLSSGVVTFLSWRNYTREGLTDKTIQWYTYAVALGAFFVAFQGYEWVKLISYGMTMTSSIFGATFFLLIGAHGLHAAASIVVMLLVRSWMVKGQMRREHFIAIQLFWYFVVGIWPILYGLVYF